MIRSSHGRRVFRSFALGILIWTLAFTTPAAANNCADGGQSQPDEGGIGGTGLRAAGPDDDDSGIGGTGVSADAETGIIGTITGFDSICVGHVEIHYSPETPVHIDGQTATPAQLAVGQVVEVVATGHGSAIHARQIAVRHVISGPITRVDARHNEIDVMGETVRLSPVTRAGDGNLVSTAVATDFSLSASVQVSGMRRSDGVVVASRVSRVEPERAAQVAGPLTALGSGIVQIAGTPVRADSRGSFTIGDEVRVVGHWDGGALVAQSMESIPRVPFDGRVAHIDIEGFARRLTGERLQIGPFPVEVSAAAAQAIPRATAPEARIRIQGIVQDRHVIVQRIDVTDEIPPLPPVPPRNLQGSAGGPPANQQDLQQHGGPPPRDDDNIRPEAAGGIPASGRPDMSDRPPAPQMPDRPDAPPVPDRPDAPPVPDRPDLPQVPDRPVPQLPDRPPRPERPPPPARADMPGRP